MGLHKEAAHTATQYAIQGLWAEPAVCNAVPSPPPIALFDTMDLVSST